MQVIYVKLCTLWCRVVDLKAGYVQRYYLSQG